MGDENVYRRMKRDFTPSGPSRSIPYRHHLTCGALGPLATAVQWHPVGSGGAGLGREEREGRRDSRARLSGTL